MSTFLIYGANTRITHEAAARGMRPILAGRNADAIKTEKLGLEHHAWSLDDLAAVIKGIEGAPAALHCARPFAHIKGNRTAEAPENN